MVDDNLETLNIEKKKCVVCKKMFNRRIRVGRRLRLLPKSRRKGSKTCSRDCAEEKKRNEHLYKNDKKN